jgi:hypothetical protein
MLPVDRHPSSRQLTVFGLTWLVFFAVWGAAAWWRWGSPAMGGACWIAAAAVPLLGLVVPGLLRIIYLGSAYAALPVGLAASYVILAAIYYLVATPIGLTLRLFGHDPLHRRCDREAETYWAAHEPREDVEDYFRQF